MLRLPEGAGLPLPSYMSAAAAGADVCAAVAADLTLAPGARSLVPAGFALAIPAGFEVQIRPRSGLALKHGVTLLNSPGTIDADYRGPRRPDRREPRERTVHDPARRSNRADDRRAGRRAPPSKSERNSMPRRAPRAASAAPGANVKVYVVGAGAIGTYLGELLRATGAEVTYAPRRLEEVGQVVPDLAIVAVKAYDTPGAIRSLQRALAYAPETTILTVQNGVGNEELLAHAFGADRIAAGALTVPVERGRRRPFAGGAARRARPRAGRRQPAQLARRRLRAGGAARRRLRRLPRAEMVEARAQHRRERELRDPRHAPERARAGCRRCSSSRLAAVRETHAVMQALSLRAVDLPRYPVRAFMSAVALPGPLARGILAGRFAKSRGAKPPSLLLDLRAGRRTEVGALNGAVASAGARTRSPAPVNAAFSRIVEEISADPARWAAYRGQPARLIAAAR